MFPLYNIFGFGGYDMFRSTRQNRPASGERAIVEGMDGDGGLFVPKVLPALSDVYKRQQMDIVKKQGYDVLILTDEDVYKRQRLYPEKAAL